MKKRLIVLSVLLFGCAAAPKKPCTFLYTDYRYEHGGLNPVPVYRCSRK